MQVDEKVLSRTIERFRERKILLPTFAQMRDPSSVPEKIKPPTKERRPVGRRPGEPVSHHVEKRADRKRRPVQPGQLDRVSIGTHRRSSADHRPARQVLPDGCAQGRRRLWLSRAATRERPVRPDAAQSRLAEHRQLLPRRSVRLGARRLHARRHSARGNEPRAIRVAQGDRRRGHRRRPAANRTSRRSTTSAGRSAARGPTA